MAEPMFPPGAKLFIGILYSSDEDLAAVKKKLKNKYGEIDFQTDPIPFENTDYYKGIGTDLKKLFFSFDKHIKRENISGIKIYSNSLEKKFSTDEGRRVNIDPGYMTLSNVFLASCKDYYHRVYIGHGVYLENEYRYTAKEFHFWPWTYPDYQKEEYLDFFYKLRKIYQGQLN